MELIETIEVGAGGASTLTFSSIPQDGTDLVLVHSLRTTGPGASDGVDMIFNSDSGANYVFVELRGENGTVTGSTNTASNISAIANAGGSTANTFSSTNVYISNYTASQNKAVSIETISENNASDTNLRLRTAKWNDTSAITSISLSCSSEDFVQYSTVSLYKITAENNPDYPLSEPKATGGSISYENGYFIHTFTSSGSFIPTENISGVEYVVVAGGGGGGGDELGGGGGGGGYRSSVSGESSGGGASAESTLNLTTGNSYTVTIGAGGTGSPYPGGIGTVPGTNGNNSTFSTITSTGGGYGGGRDTSQNLFAPNSGGSGGGRAYRDSGSAISGVANQGFAGGTSGGNLGGAGGGGAGQVGRNGRTVYAGGDGGRGVQTSITGTATYLAGGGGGGADSSNGAGDGGLGGGGRGGNYLRHGRDDGTTNTGGGGGGVGATQTGGNGGSGIVIVRYAA